VLYAADRGALQGNMLDIPYKRVDARTYWPFTEAPVLED
jgi:hypothetical protein